MRSQQRDAVPERRGRRRRGGRRGNEREGETRVVFFLLADRDVQTTTTTTKARETRDAPHEGLQLSDRLGVAPLRDERERAPEPRDVAPARARGLHVPPVPIAGVVVHQRLQLVPAAARHDPRSPCLAARAPVVLRRATTRDVGGRVARLVKKKILSARVFVVATLRDFASPFVGVSITRV